MDFLADALNIDIVPSTSLTVIPDSSFLPPPDPSIPPAVVFNTNTFVVEANFAYDGQTASQSVNFAFGGATSGIDNVSNPDPIPPNLSTTPPTPGLNPNIPGVLTQILHLIRQKSKPRSFNHGISASNCLKRERSKI